MSLKLADRGQFTSGVGEELVLDCSAFDGVAVFIKVGVDMFEILPPTL